MPIFKQPQRYLRNATAPVGSIIAEVGRGIAQAQHALDSSALDSFKALYADGGDFPKELRQIGYIPTWYQIPETTAEINLSMTMGVSNRRLGGSPVRQLLATTVDAGTQNQFNYKTELSSKIQFRIVPIPPPITPQDHIVVPNLVGLTLSQALALMDDLELSPPKYDGNPNIDKDKTLVHQEPNAGELMAPDETIRLFSD